MIRSALNLWQTIPWDLKFSFIMTLLGIFCVGGGYVWWRGVARQAAQDAGKVTFELGEHPSQRMDEHFNQATTSSSEAPLKPPHARSLVVGVVGMVAKPGLYELPTGSRVMDALQKAGGLTETARNDVRLLTLNIARQLTDGETIAVGRDEVRELREQDDLAAVRTNQTSVSSNPTISVNTASQSELEMLPGIGPKYAQKMIEKRPFISPQDMQERTEIPGGVLSKVFPLINYGE